MLIHPDLLWQGTGRGWQQPTTVSLQKAPTYATNQAKEIWRLGVILLEYVIHSPNSCADLRERADTNWWRNCHHAHARLQRLQVRAAVTRLAFQILSLLDRITGFAAGCSRHPESCGRL